MNLEALYKISYGLYVICSADGERINGQIVNSLVQVTAEPPKIAVSINKKNLTHAYIKKSGCFSVSILSQDTPMKFIGRFGFKSGRDTDKFEGVNYETGKLKVPMVLDNALACVEARVVNSVDVGTHTLFIAEVVDAKVLKEGEPLTYDYYHKIKGGFSPENAPTYNRGIVNTKKEVTKGMEKYVCKICGYVYDPEKGDPENGIKPGTSFEDLPDDWVCPICGAGKEEFEKET